MKWIALVLALAISIAIAFVLSINAWAYVTGFVFMMAIVGPAIHNRNKPKRNTRRPKIYGESRPATISEMAEGGITTERR
jgi:predicted membrane protein